MPYNLDGEKPAHGDLNNSMRNDRKNTHSDSEGKGDNDDGDYGGVVRGTLEDTSDSGCMGVLVMLAGATALIGAFIYNIA